MEKFWSSLHENKSEGLATDMDVEIIQTLNFSSYSTIGEIRAEFESWSLQDLEWLAQHIYFMSADDEGVYHEVTFGERYEKASEPFREAVLLQSFSNNVFQKFNKKKRFF